MNNPSNVSMNNPSNISRSTPSLNTQKENHSDTINPVSSFQDDLTQLVAVKTLKNYAINQTTEATILNNSFTEIKNFKCLNQKALEKIIQEIKLNELSKQTYIVTKISKGIYKTDNITGYEPTIKPSLLLIMKDQEAFIAGNEEEVEALQEYSNTGGTLEYYDENKQLCTLDPSKTSTVVVSENFNRNLLQKIQAHIRNQENSKEHRKENPESNVNDERKIILKETKNDKTSKDLNLEKQKDYNNALKLRLFLRDNIRFFENLTEKLSQIKMMKKKSQQNKKV